MNYYNKYGLLNSKKEEDFAENSPLWTLEYYLLTKNKEALKNLMLFIIACRTPEPGLYNQRPDFVENKDDYMSPDQLIAFICALFLNDNKVQCRLIWKYLKKHFFNYNNVEDVTKRYMQPKAILTSWYCGSWIGKILATPILSIACIVSCLSPKKETSGKLKAWVIMRSLKLHITYDICTVLVDSWESVFKTYFKESDHPIRSIKWKE